MAREWSQLSLSQMTKHVEVLQQYITLHLYEAQVVDQQVRVLPLSLCFVSITPNTSYVFAPLDFS